MKIFSRGNMLRCDLNNVRFHTPAITKNSSNYNSFSDGSGMSNLTYFSISIHCQQHVVMMFVLTDSQCSDCTALHVVARHLCTRVNIPQAERPTVMGCDYGVKRPDGKNTHHLGGVLKTDGISIAISFINILQTIPKYEHLQAVHCSPLCAVILIPAAQHVVLAYAEEGALFQ